jgi:hypothetical protein
VLAAEKRLSEQFEHSNQKQQDLIKARIDKMK